MQEYIGMYTYNMHVAIVLIISCIVAIKIHNIGVFWNCVRFNVNVFNGHLYIAL